MDFSKAKKPVTLAAVRKHVKRARGLATRVFLPGIGTSTEGIPRYITTRCKNLKELIMPAGMAGATLVSALVGATSLKSLIIGSQCQITADCVSQVLSVCKGLERAEFHGIISGASHASLWGTDRHKLRSLVMNAVQEKGSRKLVLAANTLIERIPNIHTLVLHSWMLTLLPYGHTQPGTDFAALGQLEHLDISGSEAKEILRLPTSVRSLDVTKFTGPEPGLQAVNFTQLVRLSTADSRWMNYISLRAMLYANLGNLTHFNSRRGVWLVDWWTDIIRSGYFQRVIELNLDFCPVDDDIIGLLAQHTTALKSLSLAGTKVTGVGVRALLITPEGDPPSKLEYLCLDHCQSCSKDAAEWARLQGVKVSFKFPASNDKGRRIR